MLIYSKKIIRFIEEIKQAIKKIIFTEALLKVHGDRFYDKAEQCSYPIKVVVYNNKKMLGYFASDFYELGFNEILMHASKSQLHNIIRHELAHYLTFIRYGNGLLPHGQEFKAQCENLNWGQEVYAATTCLDDGEISSDIEESSVLRKVQKLMALATSSNPHEAELAMIKSQQLLLKHNIDANYIGDEDVEKIFLKRILKQKKETAKMRAIAKILETFFVNTVYSRSEGHIYLEIIGSAVNVEIAEYVANFLELELEKQWTRAQKDFYGLKGMVAKNSFFLGIAKGYCNKIHALKKEYSQDVSNALMVIEKKLIEARSMVYPRLRMSKSSGGHCPNSSKLGELIGKRLNINPGIASSTIQSGAFLTYSS